MDKINATKPQQQEDEEIMIIEERITKVNGDFFIKKHARGKFLGKGGFAKVYVFTNLETNKISAGKVMPKANLTRSRSKQKLMVEIRLHKSLHHPNIVKFEHVFEDHENVYIMLELCQNQSVSELIKRRKRLTEFEVQCYVIQIVEALKYLQANRIIHRDLKLGNMFLNDKMQIKLGDFGLATKLEFDGEKKRTVCGTPNYLAPEVLDGSIGHSYQVDVWSLGVIIYTMLFGRPPFETKDIKMTYKRIKECDYAFPDTVQVSDTVKDLISKILVVQPEKRLTLDEILLHPFVNSGQAIPKLLPSSTMTAPPTAQYIKQFMLSSSSQRVRLNTDAETLDANEIMKSARGLTVSTARTSTTVTKAGSDYPTLDLLRNSNPQLNFEYVNTRFNTITGGLSSRNRQFVFPEKSPELRKAPPALENIEVETVTGLKSSRGVADDFKSPVRKPEAKEATTARDIKSATTRSNSTRPVTAREIPKEPVKPVVKEAVAKESVLPREKEPEMPVLNDVYVVKFYDYTSKYGLGYLLSNGMIGVSFNDGFKMISINENEFEGITRRQSDKQDEARIYSFKDYPQELHKRVLVHAKFKEHFESALKQISVDQKQSKQSIYIKKWIKTKQGVFFRLNNRTLHVAFKDGSLVLMNSNKKLLTFVDTKYKLHTCGIEGAAQNPNADISKRVKYIEEVLTRLWTVQTDTLQTQMMTQKTEMNENLVLETRRDLGNYHSRYGNQATMETLMTERY